MTTGWALPILVLPHMDCLGGTSERKRQSQYQACGVLSPIVPVTTRQQAQGFRSELAPMRPNNQSTYDHATPCKVKKEFKWNSCTQEYTDKLVGKTSPTSVNTHTSLGVTRKAPSEWFKQRGLEDQKTQTYDELRWPKEASSGKWG